MVTFGIEGIPTGYSAVTPRAAIAGMRVGGRGVVAPTKQRMPPSNRFPRPDGLPATGLNRDVD